MREAQVAAARWRDGFRWYILLRGDNVAGSLRKGKTSQALSPFLSAALAIRIGYVGYPVAIVATFVATHMTSELQLRWGPTGLTG